MASGRDDLKCAFICLVNPNNFCHFYLLINSDCYLGNFDLTNSSIVVEHQESGDLQHSGENCWPNCEFQGVIF